MRPAIHPGPPATETVRLLDGPAAGMRTTSRRNCIWVGCRLRRGGQPVPIVGPDGLVVRAPIQTADQTRKQHPGIVWLGYMRTDLRPPAPYGWGIDIPAYAISYRWVARPTTDRALRIVAERLPS